MTHQREVETRNVWESAHDVALHLREDIACRHIRNQHVLLRRMSDRFGRKDDEEVRFEARPVDGAQIHNHGAYRDALHIPRDRVTQADAKIGRDVAFEGDGKWRVRLGQTFLGACRTVREPCA